MDNGNGKRDARKVVGEGGGEGEPSPPPQVVLRSCNLEGRDLACDASSEEERGSAQENVPSMDEEWATGVFECVSCGEHRRSDLEICGLGTFVPCVLYGMNCGEALDLPRDSQAPCMACSSLSYVGVCAISWTLFALYPMFSYSIWTCAACTMTLPRHFMRHRYNIKDTSESFINTMFCCGRIDWRKREWPKFQDNAYISTLLHQLCHLCALCQEARELQRRRKTMVPLVNPPILIPPPTQDMAREC